MKRQAEVGRRGNVVSELYDDITVGGENFRRREIVGTLPRSENRIDRHEDVRQRLTDCGKLHVYQSTMIEHKNVRLSDLNGEVFRFKVSVGGNGNRRRYRSRRRGGKETSAIEKPVFFVPSLYDVFLRHSLPFKLRLPDAARQRIVDRQPYFQ